MLWEQCDYKKDLGERRKERFSPGRRLRGAQGLIVNIELVCSPAFCDVRSCSGCICYCRLTHWGNPLLDGVDRGTTYTGRAR